MIRSALLPLLLLTALGCAEGLRPVSDPAQLAGSWVLEELVVRGATIALPTDRQPTLTADASGEAAGHSTVNQWSAKLAIEPNGRLACGGITSTKMMGGEPYGRIEMAFYGALRQVERAERDVDNRLVLTGPGGRLAFKPAKP